MDKKAGSGAVPLQLAGHNSGPLEEVKIDCLGHENRGEFGVNSGPATRAKAYYSLLKKRVWNRECIAAFNAPPNFP